MQTSEHYGLQEPEANDTVDLVTLTKTNMDIIDAQMYENAQAAAAAQTAANNAQSTANQALEAAQNISTATTTDPGTVLVSAPPTQGQQPVAVSTTDPVYENAARKDQDNAFTAKQTFGAGFDVPSGQTGTVEGTLEAGSGGVIHATNADSLGGNPPSYYLAATAQAADSAKLNGQPASYYATASSVANSLTVVSGGNKIQSGAVSCPGTISNSGGTVTVTFPTAFSSIPVVVASSSAMVITTSYPGSVLFPSSISSTSVTFKYYNNDESGTIYWIAIGN
ncbi:hypothetical protein AAC03nite_20030 [Alicyclobacillus acidoterrestris]|nr:hypothetical protein AAC03nite_20030 [Alicyclobacillus acidoterrestris]